MRITILSPDVPYPANRGGRADIWRKILALKQLGAEVQLICFYDNVPNKIPSHEHRETINQNIKQLITLPINKGIKAVLSRFLTRNIFNPWHVRCRTPNSQQAKQLINSIKEFNPTYLLLEGPWMGQFALEILKKNKIPLIYRSHNIEHLYMRGQAKIAKKIKERLLLSYSCLGLEKFEQVLMNKAIWIFDISADDLLFWRTRNIQNNSWLPSISESALASSIESHSPPSTFDVVFIGNLTTPNNIRGVEWLVNEIIPLVLQQLPKATFLIAGSNPSESLKLLCSKQYNLSLIANPDKVLPFYHSAKVLVNPVRTGSGIHVKALDMLMTDAPIVSSVQGTCGMPEEVKKLFLVSDETTIFAQLIIDSLQRPSVDLAARKHARRFFTVAGLAEAFQLLKEKTIQ